MNKITNIGLIKTALKWILYISGFLQIVLFPEIDNVVGVLVSILSMRLFFTYVFNIETLRSRPISFITLLCLFCFMYLPVPITLMDGESISHDMYNPTLTFILQFVYFALTILAFLRASSFNRFRHSIVKGLTKFGYFITPSQRNLWFLGVIGLIFKFVLLSNQFGESTAGRGSLSMFAMFLYSPILILFMPLMGGKACSKKTRIVIYAYIAFIALLLISTNSRSQMVSAVIIWAFAYLLQKIYEKTDKIWLSVRKVVFAVIAVFVVTGPISDMGTAMLITRSVRSDISFSNLLHETWDVYKDKDRLEAFKKVAEMKTRESDSYSYSMEWREKYVSNLFLDRLCNYRVADASIFHAKRAGFGNKDMQANFLMGLQLMFPGPIVKLLFGNINKEDYKYSPMDLLYSLSTNSAIHPSFIVGGDVGLGLSVFGVFYFPLVFFVYLLLFCITDSVMTIRSGRPIFSVFTLLDIYFSYFLMLQVSSGLGRIVGAVTWGFVWSNMWRLIVYRIVRIF